MTQTSSGLKHTQSRRRLWNVLVVLFVSILSAESMPGDDQTGRPTTRRLIAADSSRNRVAVIDEEGRTEWEFRIGPLHDLHVLNNGHVLLQTGWTEVLEVDPVTSAVVWRYNAADRPENAGRRVEIHAFQRLDNGRTMVAESGSARILELDPAGSVFSVTALKVRRPDPHHDTRLVRSLQSGNYLVCHEADGLVREYARDGTIHWEYEIPLFGRERAPGHGVGSFGNQCFSALRLSNGNTLIGTGNGHSVLEVTPAGQVVWSLHQNELPGIQLAWITSLQVLPGGNIVITNCHAGPSNPQIIEINRQKRVVWTFRDFERFGDSLTNSQILNVDGQRVLTDSAASLR